MELIIPLIFSVGAFILMLLGLLLQDANEDVYLLCEILATICFFVGGGCWIGVTHINPATGAEVADTGYKFLVYLFIAFGFVPIIFMYDYAFGKSAGE